MIQLQRHVDQHAQDYVSVTVHHLALVVVKIRVACALISVLVCALIHARVVL